MIYILILSFFINIIIQIQFISNIYKYIYLLNYDDIISIYNSNFCSVFLVLHNLEILFNYIQFCDYINVTKIILISICFTVI